MKLESGEVVEPKPRLEPRSHVDGILIHAFNPLDREDQRHFWVHHLGVFDSWAEVDRLARLTSKNNYGMELAPL